MTIIASELFSAEIPGRVLAGELDIGLALHPESMNGIRSEVLRGEPVAAQLSKRHRLAHERSIPLAELEDETLLLFPRELAPAYYDHIMEACERAGFSLRSRPSPSRPSTQCSHASSGHTRSASAPPRSPSTAPRPNRHRRPRDRQPANPGGVVNPLVRARPIRGDRAVPRQRTTVRYPQRLAAPAARSSHRRKRLAHRDATLTTSGIPPKRRQEVTSVHTLQRQNARATVKAGQTPLPRRGLANRHTRVSRAGVARRPDWAVYWLMVSPAVAEIVGDCRPWTVLTISALSIPWR